MESLPLDSYSQFLGELRRLRKSLGKAVSRYGFGCCKLSPTERGAVLGLARALTIKQVNSSTAFRPIGKKPKGGWTWNQ